MLLEPLIEGRADAVYGSRFFPAALIACFTFLFWSLAGSAGATIPIPAVPELGLCCFFNVRTLLSLAGFSDTHWPGVIAEGMIAVRTRFRSRGCPKGDLNKLRPGAPGVRGAAAERKARCEQSVVTWRK